MEIILTEENSITSALSTVGIEAIKSELQKNVDFSKSLEITNFEDKKQYQLVKDTKNGYVKTRNTIKRAFKSKRDEYNQLAKENLEAEREVIAVIENEEKRLDEIVEKADKLKLRKENESKLELRINELAKYEYVEENEVLLDMKEKDFEDLLTTKRLDFIAKKEAELKAEQERVAREKEIEEAKKQARLEAEQEAQRQAELEKQRVEREKEEQERKQKEALERVEREKEEAIEQIKREQEEKERQEKLKKEQEEKERLEAEHKEKENQARLEKEKAYISYRDSIDFDKIEKEDGKIVFYKKVGEFKYD